MGSEILWMDPPTGNRIKIPVEAHDPEMVCFCNTVLIGIIKIHPVLLAPPWDLFQLIVGKRLDPDIPAKEIVNKRRKMRVKFPPGKEYANRIHREITDEKRNRRFSGQQVPDHRGMFTVEKNLKKNIGIEKVHIIPTSRGSSSGDGPKYTCPSSLHSTRPR